MGWGIDLGFAIGCSVSWGSTVGGSTCGFAIGSSLDTVFCFVSDDFCGRTKYFPSVLQGKTSYSSSSLPFNLLLPRTWAAIWTTEKYQY